MDRALIRLDNLGIGYDGQSVLSGTTLTIARASFTAILGANGSGKSTLLETLLGPLRARKAIALARVGVTLHDMLPGHYVARAIHAVLTE